MNESGKELRLALAMRGGVSLAIWIGGAVGEIDLLMRASGSSGTGSGNDSEDGSEPQFWKRLLDASPFDSVVADVMSGASAGGLNGVLFAASQCYGFEMRQTRDVWMRVGGLEQLVRTQDPRLSLLDGDRSFLQPLLDELTTLTGESQRPLESPAVDLILSATLTEPIRRAVSSPSDEPLFEDRFDSTFHFRNRPEAEWSSSQIVGEGDGRLARLHRMSLAARATSSFPGAFEAAFIPSQRPQNFSTSLNADTGDPLNMVGVFGDANAPGRSYAVADGGILDNIPISKAISSIQRSSADSPTRRLLLYLHPTGPGTGAAQVEAPAPEEELARSSYAVLKGAFGAKVQAETIVADIDQLDVHNRAVKRAQVFRTAAFGRGTGPPPDLMDLARAELSRYRSQRSQGDTQSVFDLIADPIGTIGSDPFPSHVGNMAIADDRWRSPLADWPEELRSDWRAGAESLFLDRSPGGPGTDVAASPPGEGFAKVFENGTGPLERTIKLLIECARHCDRTVAEGSAASPAGPLRSELYRVLAYVNDALRNPRDLAWVTSAVLQFASTSDGAGLAGDMLEAADGMAHTDQATVDRVVAALCSPGADSAVALSGFLQSRRALLDNLDVSTPEDGPVDLRVEIVKRVLVPIVSQLMKLDAPTGADGSPSGALFRALKAAWPRADGSGDVNPLAGADVLAAMEVACFQEFVAGSNGSRIEFQRLSAANRTPIAPLLSALAPSRNPASSDPQTAPTDWIRPSHKLAGEEMANFSAFVRRAWRANDWMWGRMDAVPTMVDELVTPESMQALLAGKTPEAALERVKDLAGQTTAPAGDSAGDPGPDSVGDSDPSVIWQQFFWQQVWPDFETEVAAEAGTLTTSDGPVTNIRAVLIAARQCEVLAEELAAPAERNFVPRSVDDIVKELAGYRVGMEKLGNPKVDDDVELFHRVADSAGLAVARNVELATSGAGGENNKKLPNLLGRMTRQLGRVVVTFLLGRKRDLIWALRVPIALLVLAVALVVVAVVVESTLLGLAALVASAVVLSGAVLALLFGGRLRSPGPPP